MKKTIISLLVLLQVLIIQAAGPDYTLTLDATNLKMLEVDCGAGYLNIIGDPNATGITVSANIEMENVRGKDVKSIFDKYGELKLFKQGRKAVLIAKFNQDISFIKRLFMDFKNVRINLDVIVPADLALDIDDGSGDITIRRVNGEVTIDDGSGDLMIADIHANLNIDDGSGSTNISNIVGDVNIDDGSGALIIKNVIGDVLVDDGSGLITIRKVTGNVRVDDGSGNMDIDSVGANVIVKDGSGNMSFSNVQGNVTILESGSGTETFDNIGGEVIRKD
ncbi:MAG: hypothetical protein Kow00108_21970 [Calditrichia bacterium]